MNENAHFCVPQTCTNPVHTPLGQVEAQRDAATARAEQAEAERDQLRARLADIGEVSAVGTEWGAEIGASVRGADCVSDAYDLARAYGGSVRTRQLYAGPWREVDDSAGEEGGGGA